MSYDPYGIEFEQRKFQYNSLSFTSTSDFLGVSLFCLIGLKSSSRVSLEISDVICSLLALMRTASENAANAATMKSKVKYDIVSDRFKAAKAFLGTREKFFLVF